MKKIYITLLSLACAASVVAQSVDGTTVNGGIEASNIKLTQSSGDMILSMTLHISANSVPKNQGIAVIPVLSDGILSADFSSVLVNGRNMNQSYKRKSKYRKNVINLNKPMVVVKADRKFTGTEVNYSGRVKREDWMTNGKLDIKYVLISYAGERQFYSTAISGTGIGSGSSSSEPQVIEKVVERIVEKIVEVPAEPQIVYVDRPVPIASEAMVASSTVHSGAMAGSADYASSAAAGSSVASTPVVPVAVEPVPVLIAAATPDKPQNTYQLSGNAYLDFKMGSAQLVAGYRRNAEELAVIRKAMNHVINDPNAVVVSLSVVGYASPDGPYRTNRALAQARTQALSDYLQDHYGIYANYSTVGSVAEDWKSLRKLVTESSLPYKSAILEVIDSSEAPDAKETKLRKMMGGQIWRYMEDNIFPLLRRVEYKLNYEVAE